MLCCQSSALHAFAVSLVVIGLLYMAYPDDCPMRGHRLLCTACILHCTDCITPVGDSAWTAVTLVGVR